MLDIRCMPYKEGWPQTFWFDFRCLWSREAFYCSNKRRAYNGFRRLDSISFDISTMSRVLHVNLFYIASACNESVNI